MNIPKPMPNLDIVQSIWDDMDKMRKQMVARFEAFGTELHDVRNWRDPINTQGRIENIELAIQELREQTQKINTLIGDLMNDGRFILTYDDKEIQDYYIRSKVSPKEIALKFNVSEKQAVRYSKGDIADIAVRSELVNYLRKKAIEVEARKV